METNLGRNSFSNKSRDMRNTSVSSTPRVQTRGLDGGSAAQRGEPRGSDNFSFGKIPNKKG